MRLPRISLCAALLAAIVLTGSARAFTVSGRFLYEDRMWDKNGYTGAVQNLPIRHAKVEVVNVAGGGSLASGSTDANGFYSLDVTGQILPVSFYVRCSTDGSPAGYFVNVLDNFVRNPLGGLNTTGATTYAIVTDSTLANPPTTNVDKGTFLIQDLDGSGVAQAFNILDCGMDMFEWVASADVNGALPTSAQSLTYAWKPLTGGASKRPKTFCRTFTAACATS